MRQKNIIAVSQKLLAVGLAVILPLLSLIMLLWLVRSSAKPVLAHSCEVYPLALHEDIFFMPQPGDTFSAFAGDSPGTFGWRFWNPDPSKRNNSYLVMELQNPALSLTDFTNVNDLADHILSNGDDIALGTGFNSNDVAAEIQNLINNGTSMRVAVHDMVHGAGLGTYAPASSFIMVRINDYIVSPQAITFTYLGPTDDPEGCRDFGLSLTPSQSQSGSPGQLLTYTHILTNQGHYTETVVLTYTTSLTNWPVFLSFISQTLAPRQAITLTAAITIPASSPIDITHTTQLTAALAIKPSISATVVDTTTVLDSQQIFLPLLLKQ